MTALIHGILSGFPVSAFLQPDGILLFLLFQSFSVSLTFLSSCPWRQLLTLMTQVTTAQAPQAPQCFNLSRHVTEFKQKHDCGQGRCKYGMQRLNVQLASFETTWKERTGPVASQAEEGREGESGDVELIFFIPTMPIRRAYQISHYYYQKPETNLVFS